MSHRITVADSLLTSKKRHEVVGTSPNVIFEMQDGSKIVVVHSGNHIQVTNPDRTWRGIRIMPLGVNQINIFVEKP